MTGVPCDCCEGVAPLTPEPVANRPGLPALRYRVGTHSSFLSTMLTRLSADEFEGLRRLATRDPADPAIALLDVWATIADVLTFYQERIANEGYLRTATELRSVLELARLVGYEPRPGVAADTHLAFELETGNDEVVPAGIRVQSIPAPGALPQVYETSEPLAARAAFNAMRVRTSRPQAITVDNAGTIGELWLSGIATRLQPNDAVAVAVGSAATLRFVASVEEDAAADRTRVVLQGGRFPRARQWTKHTDLDAVLDAVSRGRRAPARRDPKAPAGPLKTDTRLRLARVFRPEVADVVYRAWANAVVTKRSNVRVYAMRVRASLFGHNAPRKPEYHDENHTILPPEAWSEWGPNEDDGTIFLDNAHPGVQSGSIVAVVRSPLRPPLLTLSRLTRRERTVGDEPVEEAHADGTPSGAVEFFGLDHPLTADVVARSEYGVSAKSTRVTLHQETWLPPQTMAGLRGTVVFAQSEELALGEEPVTDDVCRDTLELAELYEGLEPGRRLVVTGERADIPGVRGVMASELVTVADVRQGAAPGSAGPRRGDRNRTFLVLAGGGLKRCYHRATVTVFGNVVHATHGETRSEVLGSGDARVAHQSFALRANPLTYVSAPTPSGVESSLEVRVDGVRWPERAAFVGLAPSDRGYLVRADEARVTTVVFPGGHEGRRLPSGTENVRARFRSGIGTPGNTDAGSISLLLDKPLSVKGVTNPLPATGGADAEGRDEAREHAPLPLRALDRLVSVADYGSFARTFAGVGKAVADRMLVGGRAVLVVTVAGADGIALSPHGDLVKNLRRALRRFGDPSLPVRVLVADRLVLRLAARVRLLPDYEWASVEPPLRSLVTERFGFAARDLAADVSPSEVLAVLHEVEGVASAALDALGAVADGIPPAGDADAGPARVVARGARIDDAGVVRPAEHLYAAIEVPELVVLREARA